MLEAIKPSKKTIFLYLLFPIAAFVFTVFFPLLTAVFYSFFEWKNGPTKTFNGITIRKNLLPYVIYRNVEFSTDTGIDTRISAADAPKDIYDLAGRRVQEAHRGVFIMDHHKVLVK